MSARVHSGIGRGHGIWRARAAAQRPNERVWEITVLPIGALDDCRRLVVAELAWSCTELQWILRASRELGLSMVRIPDPHGHGHGDWPAMVPAAVWQSVRWMVSSWALEIAFEIAEDSE